MFRQTADHVIATYDDENRWFDGSVIGLIPAEKSEYSLLYILGLLNSKYFKWHYQKLVNEEARVFAQVKLSKVKQLPIRIIDFKNKGDKTIHNSIALLADKILTAKKANPAANTKTWEDEIDEKIFALYGLTKEEVEIIKAS